MYNELKGLGLEPVIKPVLNIVTFKVSGAQTVRKRLCDMNWYVSTTSRPESLRMVVMPHVTKNVIESYVADLKKILDVV